MSTSTLSAVDADTGNKIPLVTFDDANGNTAVGHVVLAGTPLVPVAPGNPLPVADSAAEAALATLGTNTAATMTAAGTPSDAAWAGSGAGTLVALLKALYGELAGTLTSTITGVTTVSGAGAVGTAPSNPPLSVSGVDAQGLKRQFLTDGNGVIQVAQASPLPTGTNTIGSVTVSGTSAVTVENFPAMQPVSGTVTANQGGAPWSMSLAAGSIVGIAGTPTVTVGNFPVTQVVSGTVTVGNLPTTQAVSGTVVLGAGSQVIGTVGITGTVAVADSAGEASLATIAANTAGLATATGQVSALTQQSATATASGTPADAAYSGSGSGSLIALLKGIFAEEATGNTSLTAIAANTAAPAPRVLVSRSVATTAAGTSSALVAANAARRLLRVQAPQGSGVWLNLLGGTAGANAPDCLYLAPGDVFEGQDTNAATYWCATGGLVLSAWEA